MATRGNTDAGGVASFYDPARTAGYKSGLWKDCPLLEYMFDPSIGTMWDYSGHDYDAEATVGNFVLTQATAGSAAMSTTDSGTLLISAGSTTSTHGANVQRVKSAFIPAADKHIWAEFNVSWSGVGALNVETAVGLFEIDTTVIGSSAVSTDNHIGFTSVTDDGILLFNSEKAAAGATAAAHTIVSATKVKLGFKVTGVTSVQAYVNGVATGDAVATANVPIVAVYPTFVCQSGGTDSPVLHLHNARIFQLR
jgi:hypothetical protein